MQNFILNYFIFVDKEEKYDSMLTMLTNSSIAMRNKLIKLLKDISEYKPQEKMLSCHQGYEAILLIISNEEGLCASQISKKINISQARLSKIVNRLKKDNLILFFQDEKNNRINRIYLTEKGKKKSSELLMNIDKEFEELINYMGKENIEDLISKIETINCFIKEKKC